MACVVRFSLFPGIVENVGVSQQQYLNFHTLQMWRLSVKVPKPGLDVKGSPLARDYLKSSRATLIC